MFLQLFESVSRSIKAGKIPGLVFRFSMECNHCRFEGFKSTEKHLVQRMLERPKADNVYCKKEALPFGLLAPLPCEGKFNIC